jgi:succinate dehydrogenase/fumarate reductase flavoprotein subunit
MKQERLKTDVLVLGGGGAGLRAALEARRGGAEVTLVSKQPAGGASCTSHGAGYLTCCAEDARNELRRQVFAVGGFVNDAAMVEAFVADVPTRVAELVEFGVALSREEVLPGLGYWRTSAGEGHPAGYGLTTPLRRAAESSGAHVVDGAAAIRLLCADGTVVGAFAYQPSNDRLVAITAKATILATGGGAALWKRSDNPRGTTGDGFALALEAGAWLANMEFVSFNCPDVEAILAGEADREGLLGRGSAHYFLGGVHTDASCRTSVEGLLAAGEVASGPFGAARLGGSAFAEIIVFGARAGAEAARRAASVGAPSPSEETVALEVARLESYRRNAGAAPSEHRRRLAEIMWSEAGPLKDGGSLARAAKELEALAAALETASATTPDEVLLAEQTRLSCVAAREVVRASAWRKETRGAFWRTDYPRHDNDRWLVHRRARSSGGRYETEITPVRLPCGIEPGVPKVGAGCFGYLPQP